MKTPLVILGIVLTAAAMSPQIRVTERHAADLTAPFTMRDEFQGDGLGQWASYPPAQDVGYEPSLTPTTQPTHAPNERPSATATYADISGQMSP